MSTEGALGGSVAPLIGAPHWRAEREAAQQQAMPAGSVTVSCSAPYRAGGLGRHMGEICDALARNGESATRICEAPGEGPAGDPVRELRLRRRRLLAPLTRRSPAWRVWASSRDFDAQASDVLGQGDHLIAFNGTSLAQLRAARAAGWSSLAVASATTHMERVVAQHQLAHRQYPLEAPWSGRLLARSRAEYALADRVYVSSEYTRQTFIDAGYPAERLWQFPLTPDARFQPPATAPSRETFEILYVGGLTIDKGVPLLLDAFAALPFPDLRLVLIGGWKTAGMRRRVQQACATDSRVQVSHGDPLAALQRASLYVHPAYSDGFGYAPAEAMACGVPVIVSEDTGMKELISAGFDGLVLPTGELAPLTEAIAAAYRGELFAADRGAGG